MPTRVDFSIEFFGSISDEHTISFYDVAEALIGFERSLALTAHLVINGKVITKAPALKGAEIFATPPENGSWKLTAIVLAAGTGIMQLNAVPKDTPLGNMFRSAYDYIVSETLGFHVDYEKTLGTQYEEYQRTHPKAPNISQSKLDSVIEKCLPAIRSMHRPIYASKTATSANILCNTEPFDAVLTEETFNYVDYTRLDENPIEIIGRISSYNINTYSGRIYSFSEQRPIQFELHPNYRDARTISLITHSLSANAISRERGGNGDLSCSVWVHYSRTGTVKRFTILEISPRPQALTD